MGRKKNVEKGFEVKDNSIKVEKFPSHANEVPMVQSLAEDGETTVFTPSDPFCSVKVKGYFDDGQGYSGYEIVAKRYEKDGLFQWVRGRKWELVGYVKNGRPTWLVRSPWLSDMLGVLIEDIRAYETIMKHRIMEAMT